MTKLVLAAGLLATASIVAAAAPDPAVVAVLLNQGNYWLSKGRQDLAQQAYRRVLAVDPGNVAARRGLAGLAPAKPAATTPPRAAVPAPRAALPAARAVAAAKPAPRPPVAVAPPPVAAPPTFAAVVATPKPAARPAANDPGGDARAAGFRELDAGNLDGAARNFRRALVARPGDSDALGGIGIVRLRQKNFAEARDYLARASGRGGGGKWAAALASARFFAGLDDARAALAAGRIDDAQKMAEDLSNSTSPARGPALELLGGIYEAKGHYAEAAELFRTAASLDGTPRDAVTGLERRAGRAQAMQAAAAGSDTDAEQFFRRGMVEAPADPWIRYDYARFLDSRGRQGEVRSIITALASLPGPEPLYAAALLSSQIGQAAAAEALMARIPEGGRTAEMRGFALGLKTDTAIERSKQLAARGETTAALGSLREIAQAPGLPMGKQGALAGAILDLGDTAGAASLAERALGAKAAGPEDYEPVVRVLARTGQDGLAATAVQRAGELAGTAADGQKSVARLSAILAVSQAERMRQDQDYAAAFDLLQRAWQASPGNTDVLAALARVYQSGGLDRQAAQTFRMVLETTPSDKGALLGLVDTAGASGDFVLARGAAERAARLYPSDYEVYLAASRMERNRGDDRTAARYLKRARELYLAQSQASGGFGTGNPFARTRTAGRADPFAAPVNPFALGNGGATRASLDLPDAASGGDRRRSRGGAFAGDVPNDPADPFGAPSPGDTRESRRRTVARNDIGAADPVLRSIDEDLQALGPTGTRADVRTDYRQRSGETGLSELREVGGTAELSTGFAGGRVSAKATALALDAGRPSGSGLARFGRNPTPEAQGIVAALPSALVLADTQHASGVAVSAGYENRLVKADVGSTPLGFGRTTVVGGVTVTPRLSPTISARIWGERRPVTDSVVAYAGTNDPVSGQFWGAVRRAGGGASLSYDRNGSGLYADGSWYRYTGRNVRRNTGLQVNAGGYTEVMNDGTSSIILGINGNYQDYANNQNFFTFGHGGYFSPQSFFSVSFPLRYKLRRRGLEIDVSAAPGYQSYNQKSASLYPTDPAGQLELDALKALDNDVRASFDSISQTGFGLAAGASAYYPVNPTMKVGGDVNYNSFGDYNELRASVGIKQTLGGQR